MKISIEILERQLSVVISALESESVRPLLPLLPNMRADLERAIKLLKTAESEMKAFGEK